MDFFLDKNQNYTFFGEEIYEMYNAPYMLSIKVENSSDNNSVELKTDKVLTIVDLPKNISELFNNYDILQHYVCCYEDNCNFNIIIKFIGSTGCFSTTYRVKVSNILQKIEGSLEYTR
jgi:hypothetical protein